VRAVFPDVAAAWQWPGSRRTASYHGHRGVTSKERILPSLMMNIDFRGKLED
jgi:hypothetical protein